MKTGRKIGFVVLAVMLIGIMGISIMMRMQHSGKIYYVCIMNSGEETDEMDDESRYTKYRYQETGFDNKGESLEVEFYGYGEKAFERGTYLKLIHNKVNGVVRYSEISEEVVPEKALERMKKHNKRYGLIINLEQINGKGERE